jgi:FAD/FMN-containing dehydrogenase
MIKPPTPALLDELASLLGPRGFTRDAESMAPWLIDWRKRYRGAAAAMLSPASTTEVASIVRLCASAGVALVPQGGNSSMVGGATPDGDGNSLLLSLRRMNSIRSISSDGHSAVCEAGVILSDFHDRAAAVGRRFPLSLAAKGSATIGGLVSTNAGGTQVLRFGTMRGLVDGIEAVLPDGALFDGLASLKKDNRGYDLKQLLIGAEGTLGIVTAARLRLVPAAVQRRVAWIGLASAEDALQLLRLLQRRAGEALESFELVPQACLDLVLRHIPETRAPLQAGHRWNVLLEAASASEGADLENAIETLLGEALAADLIEDAVIAASEAQANALWRIRESISEAEAKQGAAAKHDISVEVEAMPSFMAEAAAAIERRFPGTEVVAFGHLGDGNVHFNVMAPAGASPEWLHRDAPTITAAVHNLVTAAGGSISAEHGIGQARLVELQRLGDPVRLAAMRAIKQALDPNGIMNPGKLVPLAETRRSP